MDSEVSGVAMSGVAKGRLLLLLALCAVVAGCQQPTTQTIDLLVTADPASCPTTDLAGLQIGCEATATVTVRDPDGSVRLDCLPVPAAQSLADLLTGLESLDIGSIAPGATLALSVYGGVFQCGAPPGAAPLLLAGTTPPFAADHEDGVVSLALTCSVGQEDGCQSSLESCLNEAGAASCDQLVSNFSAQCEPSATEDGCNAAQEALLNRCSEQPGVVLNCEDLFSQCFELCGDSQDGCEGPCTQATTYCEQISGQLIACSQAYDVCIGETDDPSCCLTSGDVTCAP